MKVLALPGVTKRLPCRVEEGTVLLEAALADKASPRLMLLVSRWSYESHIFVAAWGEVQCNP